MQGRTERYIHSGSRTAAWDWTQLGMQQRRCADTRHIALHIHLRMRMQQRATPALPRLQEKMDAVVKIFCNHLQPDFGLPWQRSGEVESSSSAFVIEDTEGQRYLLTNAHSVEYHSQVHTHAAHFAHK